MNDRRYTSFESPIGWIALLEEDGRLRRIVIRPDRVAAEGCVGPGAGACAAGGSAVLAEARRQIDQFFCGRRLSFDLPLELGGLSPFALDVLTALRQVPWGEVVSYGELACLSGHPGAARAVGRVMALNPLPLVIPCHRVLGAGRRLGGYSAGEGVPTKEYLLRFEKSHPALGRDASLPAGKM